MDLTIPLKLFLAAVLGGIIGIEREIRDKPAGLRTNILICVGSALFMVISMEAAKVFGGDPTRIAAQIISGIGFLGAGAVIQSHGFVLGLTTAATIWVVAGVGMALGSEMYGAAVFATAMTIVTLYFLSFIEDRIQSRKASTFTVTVSNMNSALPSINQVLQNVTGSTPSYNFRKNAKDYSVWFNLLITRELNRTVIERLSRLPEVLQVETGSSVRDFAGVSRNDEEAPS